MNTNNESPSGRGELREILWTFRREFLVVGIFSCVTNLLMLAPTLYMLQIYDRVLVSMSELTLLAVSLVTLFLFLVTAFADWSRARVLVRTGVRIDGLLGTRVFNASFEAYLSQSGNNPSKAFSDLLQIRQFITGNGVLALFDAPWAPIYIAVLFILHPTLGWIALGFGCVQAALAWFGHRRMVKPAEEASNAQVDAHLYLQSKLRNAEVLESMGMLRNLRRMWNKRYQAAVDLGADSQHLNHRITAVSKFVRYSQQSLALGAGALLVVDGQLTPGAMIAANVLMTRALAPIDLLVNTWRSYVAARAAFDRLERLLDLHPERDSALQRVAPTGALSLRGVEASAPGRSSPILRDIDLEIAAGSVTVVLGPSGSGKSTLARVMVGIWPDIRGEVLLDQLPLAGWNRVELGPHIGYLPQDVELFEGSIAENISRFGELESAKVIEAAKACGLHEMILRFPKGYDTPIGEAGNLLSGGQRQRIALARAIYGNPALVVLDEPNANLDDAGEAALVKTVQELKRKGRTVLLITHRPGAIAVADRLVVLQQGRIQYNGPRDEVLAAMRAAARPAAARDPGAGSLQPA